MIIDGSHQTPSAVTAPFPLHEGCDVGVIGCIAAGSPLFSSPSRPPPPKRSV